MTEYSGNKNLIPSILLALNHEFLKDFMFILQCNI